MAVLPHAAQADWLVLSDGPEGTEYHASSPMLELHGADTEAYLHGLTAQEPSIYVVLRENLDSETRPLDVLLVLARNQKVDLAQISILQLAEQYLEFVAVVRRVRRFRRSSRRKALPPRR